MKIEILNEKDELVFDTLVDGVKKYNARFMGDEESRSLSVIARDKDDKLIGGVSGRTIYKQFLIEVVWIERESRGTGLGRRLMELAEVEAIKRGCVAAQVDTLSFQGPGFYANLGFEVLGKISDFSESHERYFLIKRYQ